MKMQRTIVIRRDYLHYVRKYNRFEKRHKNLSVHLSPCFRHPKTWALHSCKLLFNIAHATQPQPLWKSLSIPFPLV
uniref:Ribosomal protein S17 n=1 Tax=Eptatretus burgeri TaxID=7764 RepID=A0A8C4QZ19_EPTBU